MASGAHCGHFAGGHMFNRKPDPYIQTLEKMLSELEAILGTPRQPVRLSAGDCVIPSTRATTTNAVLQDETINVAA
jgi:hypothetical protein